MPSTFDDSRIFVHLPAQVENSILGVILSGKLENLVNNQIPTGNQSEIGYTSPRPNVGISAPMGPSFNLTPAGSVQGRTAAALYNLYNPAKSDASLIPVKE